MTLYFSAGMTSNLKVSPIVTRVWKNKCRLLVEGCLFHVNNMGEGGIQIVACLGEVRRCGSFSHLVGA